MINSSLSPALAALLQGIGQQGMGQPGMEEPEGTWGPNASESAIRALTPGIAGPVQNSTTYTQQAYAIPDAPQRHMAFRTPDLLALLGAALTGPNAGQFLGGYLGAKQQGAQQDTQRDQAGVDRQRQALLALANSASGDEKQAFEANQSQLTRANDLEKTKLLVGGRSNVAQIGADSREKTAVTRGTFGVKIATLKADAAKKTADLASQDKKFAQLIGMATKGTPEERTYALGALRDNYQDEFGGLTDQEVAAGANLTMNELDKKASADAKIEQRNVFHQQAGYYGARMRNLDAMTPVAKALAIARAKKADADAHEAISRSGLDEAQAAGIRERTKFYEPEFRLKQATFAAKLAKVQNGDVSGLQADRVAKDAYRGMASVAKDQIARILKSNNGEAPKPIVDGQDNPDFQAYQMAVHDQNEARKGLREIGQKAVSRTMNPVTVGRPVPPVGTGQPVHGGIGAGAAAGAAYQKTRGGIKFRVLP